LRVGASFDCLPRAGTWWTSVEGAALTEIRLLSGWGAPCSQVEGVSKKRRGIGGGASGAAGSQASSPRRDRGLAVDFKESQVRGSSNCFCFVL